LDSSHFPNRIDEGITMVREIACVISVAVAMFAAALPAADMRTSSPLELVQTVPLPGVRGRIDHLAVDADEGRLFVAALGNDSVEVVDLRAWARVAQITGLREPQGIGYVRNANRLVVANAGGGVDLFDASSRQRLSRIEGLDDADNVRLAPDSEEVYVGYDHALAVIDAGSGTVLDRIQLAGHPESFQLESKGARIFVNVPSATQIAVIDRSKRAVIARWNLGDKGTNLPMALDEASHRLFVATRKPAALLVFDTQTGARRADLPIGGDADDLFYDGKRKRLYVICGEGLVDVFGQTDADHYERAAEVRTVRGARTGLFVQSRDSLYVAVPAHAGGPAEIRAFNAR
jgi:DNA-binding beta-propeller fold protein YncE